MKSSVGSAGASVPVTLSVASRSPRAVASSVDRPDLVVVCGPTGSGKTTLIQQLATEMDLVVVNADSRQIYRGFDIGTAKPTAAERARVPHACVDLAEPTERYTAYRWAAAAESAIAAARRARRTPVVVGGAGFYIRALAHPVTDDAPAGRPHYSAHYLVVDPGPVLRERIAQRAESMVRDGWPDEVERLMRVVPPGAPAWQSSGYGAIRRFVTGELSRTAALTQVVTATQQYAKRQRTWFRHQLPAAEATRLDPDRDGSVPEALRWLRAATRRMEMSPE